MSGDGPFRVLGVALVVDQKGSGARLVARYPTQPPNIAAENVAETPDRQNTDLKAKSKDCDDDLFFSLTARQIAKLFRTKKSLCSNPMTLSVNGTIFCCRAIMMQDDGGNEESNGKAELSDDSVELFSVIVAMSAPLSHGTVRFSTKSWLDTATEDQLDIQRYIKETSTLPITTPEARHRNSKRGRGSISASFLSIRRVHISLARYCRVLEREERRCQYISLQTNHFATIRNELQKKWEEKKIHEEMSGGVKKNSGGVSSNASVVTTKSGQTSTERRNRHSRTSSFSAPMVIGGDDLHSQAHKYDLTIEEEQEKEQEILELMLAAPLPQTGHDIPKHGGNLARELIQVFHALSRNDHIFPATASSMLMERDGVVHVNQHIAIPVEAAGPKPSYAVANPMVRSYHTLLFPHASPSELLNAFQSSGSVPPQQIQQLLLTVNAQKSLTEIALDASLSLSTTLELASYLVTQGACVMSPVVSRQSRLTCNRVDFIPNLALEFSQIFGSVHLFRVVGFLSSSPTLGEAMTTMTNLKNEDGSWLRSCIHNNRSGRADTSNLPVFLPEDTLVQPPRPQELSGNWKEELEEQLYAMAVWLISHRVLAQLQDYFVVVATEHDDIARDRDSPSAPGMVHISEAQSKADDNLFRELLESDFLNGDVSIVALSGFLGLDQQKVRAWGMRHQRIRLLSRIGNPGDDWEA